MIQDVLQARGANYGSFENQACLVQSLKRALHSHPNWDSLDDDIKESFEMVVHKMARVVNGNPDYVDSYVDIVGYIQLVINRLEKKNGNS